MCVCVCMYLRIWMCIGIWVKDYYRDWAGKAIIHPTIPIAWKRALYDRKTLSAKEMTPLPVAWCNPPPPMPKSVLWCAWECGAAHNFVAGWLRSWFSFCLNPLQKKQHMALAAQIADFTSLWHVLKNVQTRRQAEASGSFNAQHPEFPKELFKWWAGNLTGTKCQQTQSCKVFRKEKSWRRQD